MIIEEIRDSKFYEKRLRETVTDGSCYIPELLLAILKLLERQQR